MNDVKQLTHRQRQALVTQQMIVDAARMLFLEQGGILVPLLTCPVVQILLRAALYLPQHLLLKTNLLL